MTIHELTYGISFLTPLWMAFSEGRKGGFLGILIGLLVGLALGIWGIFVTKAIYKWVRQHPELGKRNPGPFWGILSWTLYITLFACFGGMGVVGMLATKLLVRFVS
jgi:hypothetical protein